MATRASVSLAELAASWLSAKRAMESAAQAKKHHSDRARRDDLARWGSLLVEVTGRSPGEEQSALEVLRPRDLSIENILEAAALARRSWAEATVNRMLSTLRGFCRWLQRTGHFKVDPTDDELLALPRHTQRRPKALSDDDIARLLAAAAEGPATTRPRSWWPIRDVALVRFMATTGARAEEVCAVTIGELDRRAERPIWRVGTAKGGKQRDVPIPSVTIAAIDAWLSERVQADAARPALKARRADPLFGRVDGTPFNQPALDRLVRGLVIRAGAVLPDGAASHAFRHHYGVTLALRGVPSNAISQLMGHADPRTTAIYTTVAAQQLIGVLDDAGLL